MTANKQMDEIRTTVREHYGEIAERIQPESGTACGCAPAQSSCCGTNEDSSEKSVNFLYEDSDVNDLPSDVTDLSLGCGDPVTLASLTEGQFVLDLGSGGGIDCFLAAKKVGSAGKVIGVDMTPAMIDRARANKNKLGVENVEFRLGEIEHIPVEDKVVDVVISNCVINLSPDKPAVFREAFRVLKPGGKFAVSDIVTDGDLPEIIKESISAWAGCVAGAMDVNVYVESLEAAGFVDIDVNPIYWDSEMIDAAVEQLDPDIQMKIKENKKNGRKTLLIHNPDGMEIIEDFGEDFDPQKSIFSARITAWKPS